MGLKANEEVHIESSSMGVIEETTPTRDMSPAELAKVSRANYDLVLTELQAYSENVTTLYKMLPDRFRPDYQHGTYQAGDEKSEHIADAGAYTTAAAYGRDRDQLRRLASRIQRELIVKINDEKHKGAAKGMSDANNPILEQLGKQLVIVTNAYHKLNTDYPPKK